MWELQRLIRFRLPSTGRKNLLGAVRSEADILDFDTWVLIEDFRRSSAIAENRRKTKDERGDFTCGVPLYKARRRNHQKKSSEEKKTLLQIFEGDGGDGAAGMAQIPAQLAKIPAPNQSESKLQSYIFLWRLRVLGITWWWFLGFGGFKLCYRSNGCWRVNPGPDPFFWCLGFTSQNFVGEDFWIVAVLANMGCSKYRWCIF